jgi:hypothetical protein
MNRIASQTTEEWLRDYDPAAPTIRTGKSPVEAPHSVAKESPISTPSETVSNAGLYRYRGFSTRRDERGKGRLMLDMANIETGEIYTAFFNCNVTYQRGGNRNKFFKTGRKGRFWVYPGSKFAKLWLQAVGEPERWSIIYRQMRRLESISFVGQVKNGTSYQQVCDLKVLGKP